MVRKKQSRGSCAFCGYETTKGSMGRHFAACPQRSALIVQANQKPETLLHLRVQDAYGSDFWLDLEVRSGAKLKDIDSYLRGIWLECCGHLSEFQASGWGDEIAQSRTVGTTFKLYTTIRHIYDFGTSSETVLTLIGQRDGAPLTKKPVVLMARNLTPEVACVECGNPATHLCMECMIESDIPGWLCATHTTSHPHEDYGEPLAIVNSPRLGMCGYIGPATPPY